MAELPALCRTMPRSPCHPGAAAGAPMPDFELPQGGTRACSSLGYRQAPQFVLIAGLPTARHDAVAGSPAAYSNWTSYGRPAAPIETRETELRALLSASRTRNALGVSNLPPTLFGEHRIRNIPASLGRATLGRLIFGGCISSTDLRLSQPCPPYVTPSSISSFGRRLNGAHIVGSASVKDFSTKRFCQSSARSCSRSRIARPTRPCHRRHFTALMSLSMVGSASKGPDRDRTM